MAREAERVYRHPRLILEIRGVRIMASQALARLVRAVLDGVFAGFVAHGAKFPARRNRRDFRLAIFGNRLVAILTAHAYSSVNKLGVLPGMTGEAGFGLYILRLDEGMLSLLLARNLNASAEKAQKDQGQ